MLHRTLSHAAYQKVSQSLWISGTLFTCSTYKVCHFSEQFGYGIFVLFYYICFVAAVSAVFMPTTALERVFLF